MSCVWCLVTLDSGTGAAELLARIPDEPSWVDTRGMLLAKNARVIGDALVIRGNLVGVAAVPAADDLGAALAEAPDRVEVLVQKEHVDAVAALLPDWHHYRGIVHLMPGKFDVRTVSNVKLLDAHTPLDHVAGPLREELELAMELGPVVCTFDDRKAVAFCYAPVQTGKYWDVSVDTVPEYRRRGHAGRAATAMIMHMFGMGKRPVWVALESNTPSRRLAEKFGFVPVGELHFFVRRELKFPTGS